MKGKTERMAMEVKRAESGDLSYDFEWAFAV